MLFQLGKTGCTRWRILQSLGKRSLQTNTSVANSPWPDLCRTSSFEKDKFVKFTNTKPLLYNLNFNCKYCSSSEGPLDRLKFESVCTDTLDSLTEYFEELIESCPHLKNADVSYSDGVLTVQLGKPFGTYVINRQTPNLQIWLSSPTSGPKRYDFINGTWVYKHDNTTLHSLLNKELGPIAKQQVNFVEKCSYAKEKV